MAKEYKTKIHRGRPLPRRTEVQPVPHCSASRANAAGWSGVTMKIPDFVSRTTAFRGSVAKTRQPP